MENPKNQLATKLKDANNVLVTVSANPSVDQLSAAIGLTLFLTKLKKHAATVFSGQVPSTIDFLKPEENIEQNTDSLRDFIISLDKAKADKIRYKVEESMVKIFITPYRTSIGEQDLVFSQGDFNVDVVIGLGVHNREDLDQAITAHGRILHDATVATLNTKEGSDVGTLNWVDSQASSLCEMSVALTDLIKANSLDGQMATAFLTGIVAETERFSNEKTTSTTMNASAKLMAAGANQQLVATKLQPPEEEQPEQHDEPKDSGDDNGEQGGQPKEVSVDEDGSLRIDHESAAPPETEEPKAAEPPSDTLPEPVYPEPQEPQEPANQVKIDDEGDLHVDDPQAKQDYRHFLDKPAEVQEDEGMFGMTPDEGDKYKDKEDNPSSETSTKLVTEPPKFGGQLSAAADDSSSETSPLNLPPVKTPMLSHDPGTTSYDEAAPKDQQPSEPPNEPAPLTQAAEPAEYPEPAPEPPQSPPTGQPFVDMSNAKLDDIEEKVGADHDDKEPKLPEQFVKALDSSTLSGLEEKVSSPHLKSPNPAPAAGPEVDYHKLAAEQVAKAMSGTRLDEIEEKVDSPHLDAKSAGVAGVVPAEDSIKDEGPKLSYEPHESEPPDSSATSDDTSARDDDASDDSDDDDANAASDAKPTGVAADDKQNDARDAVMQAISVGGDGRTSLPPLDAIGTSGLVDVSHEDDSAKAPAPLPTPPPIAPVPQTPSSNIDIDEKGNLSFPKNLVPNNGELPTDATAASTDDASAPPPLPPPMMPPSPQ